MPQFRVIIENNGNWSVRPMPYFSLELAKKDAEQYMADKPYTTCHIAEVIATGKRTSVTWVAP